MNHKIISVWIAIITSILLSLICHSFAEVIEKFFPVAEMELPLLSKVFFPDALLIYLYPLPLIIYAIVNTILSKKNNAHSDHSLIIITITFGISMIFLVIFALGMIIPFMPVINYL